MNMKTIKTCDECGSTFYPDSSDMSSLCPECAHKLYGYKNCEHEFKNGRCLKCFWDGSTSDFTSKSS